MITALEAVMGRDTPHRVVANALSDLRMTQGGDSKAVIWMHGLGDSPSGWSHIKRELGLPKNVEVRFRACLIPGARMVSLSEHAATPLGAR